ncbi:unnamed protein product, partial [Cyprideis torosa]
KFLETNEENLVKRAEEALTKYGHHLVIANELQSRKEKVILVHRSGEVKELRRPPDQDIESVIVEEVCRLHQKHIVESTVLREFRKFEKSGSLLCVPFVTLPEYLWYLRAFSDTVCQAVGVKGVLYLAAAVADFHLPRNLMPEHKLPSDQPMELKLELVPKMLSPLAAQWARNCLIVSFKLETNEENLVKRAEEALTKYGHHLVIANELQSRKEKVILVHRSGEVKELRRPPDQDIESVIVEEVCRLHQKHIVESTGSLDSAETMSIL